ncbi:hypothetical protein GCM10027569_56260 [Flindersiella endophytica]
MSSPIMDGDTQNLQAVLHALGSGPIEEVYYVRPVFSHGATSGDNAPVHEVDLDVILSIRNTHVVISWAMDDLVQGLALVVDGVSASGLNGPECVSMNRNPQWRPILGKTIREVGIGWHTSESGCPRSVWAFRVSFHGGGSFVVALGESDPDLRYHPTTLSVIFDEEISRAYKTATSEGSAWGSVFISE